MASSTLIPNAKFTLHNSQFPLLLAAWLLIGIGCAALVAALSVVMLPHEHALTGLDVAQLSQSHGGVLGKLCHTTGSPLAARCWPGSG